MCRVEFEHQHVQMLEETEMLSDDASAMCTSRKRAMSDEGGGNLDMSDGERDVLIGEDQSGKDKSTHDIMGEGGEKEVCVADLSGHESSDCERWIS